MMLKSCFKNTTNARLTRGWRWVEPPSRTLRVGWRRWACGPSLTAAPPNAGDIAGRNQKTALQPNQKTGREKKLEEITLERD